jgi:hypothetical protein
MIFQVSKVIRIEVYLADSQAFHDLYGLINHQDICSMLVGSRGIQYEGSNF